MHYFEHVWPHFFECLFIKPFSFLSIWFLKLRLEEMRFVNSIFCAFFFTVPFMRFILLNCVDCQECHSYIPFMSVIGGLDRSTVPLFLSVSLSNSQNADVLPFNNDAFLCCCFILSDLFTFLFKFNISCQQIHIWYKHLSMFNVFFQAK